MALFIILIFINSTLIFSQNKERKFFISLQTGIHHTLLNNFEKTYESKNSLLNGFTIGVKSSKGLYFFIKSSYLYKTGIPKFKRYNYNVYPRVYLGESKEGSAEFKQLFIDQGFLYYFHKNKDWIFGISGGVNFTIITVKIITTTFGKSIKSEPNGFIGYFIGTTIEKTIKNIPISIFVEANYNHTKAKILKIYFDDLPHDKNTGGINLNFGFRYIY